MTISPFRSGLALGVATLVVATAAFAATTTDIDQLRQRFTVSKLDVWKGDVVRFVNHDEVRHNVHIIDDRDEHRDVGFQDPGQTLNVTFDKFGTFIVRCEIHQKMKMKIVVH